MDLGIKGKLFVVTGATSGFGKAIAEGLLHEGAVVIANARTKESLDAMAKTHGSDLECVAGDVTTDAVIAEVFRKIGDRQLDGVVINAGGPPVMSFMETEMKDWDQAYNNVLRWKVKFTHELLDKMLPQNYGRFVYIESAAVKQPMENLVLSNALRLAVVGFVKTLSQEIADQGITMNILAPGFHATPGVERIFKRRSMLMGISMEDAQEEFVKQIKTGHMGNPKDLASLALWLLSPQSRFITGQTLSVDGGMIKGTMG